MRSRGWIISLRCSWIMVYVFCRNAQSKYQLPNYNLFTQHVVIYLMALVNYGPRSNFLYIDITFYYFTCLFTFLHIITFYHSIRLILSLQQTGEIDNLIVSWGKVLGCIVCRFHIAAGAKQSPGRGAL
jgi:hypothetical protein